MKIAVHIDELILHGFDPTSRAVIAAAVERALTQLLAERGLPPMLCRDGAIAQLNGGSLTVGAGARPEAIGDQLAQAIYGGLSRE